MTAIDIIKTFLKLNGYDGLFNEDFECGCELDDLVPCGEVFLNCEAGHKGPCTCSDGCDWHIVPEA